VAATGAAGVGGGEALMVRFSNLPKGKKEDDLEDALNDLLLERNLHTHLGHPIIEVSLQDDGTTAECKFREGAEATNALQLDGVVYEGYTIKAARIGAAVSMGTDNLAPAQNMQHFGGNMIMVPVLPDRLCLDGLTVEFTEEEAKELVEVFGDTKFWHCIRLRPDAPVRAVFEYVHLIDERMAREAFPKIKVGDGYLEVMKPEVAVERGLLDLKQKPEDVVRYLPSAALFLKNVVKREELLNDEEYDEIVTDIRLEFENCSEGKVLGLAIPRPATEIGRDDEEGIGYAFALFETIEQATKAKRMMSGRKFGDNAVEVDFFSIKKFEAKEFANPTPNTDAPVVEGHGEEEMDMGESDSEQTRAPGPSPSPDMQAPTVEDAD
jgi:splicing factor U2AF subunit